MPHEGARPAPRGRLRIGSLVALVIAAFAGALSAPARGAVVSCGTTLGGSVKLTADVGPCPAGGIIVTASDVQIDLNGHRIFGSPETGDGIGVRLQDAQRVTLKNGSVTSFDAGIVIQGGGENKITKMKAIANIGAVGGTTFGDGILIDASRANVILSNEVRANGPFSGISVINEGSIGNKISKNTIQDNDVPSDAVNNDVGVRLESGTRETVLKENVISFSGLDGVSIFQGSKQNSLLRNTVKFNGFHDRVHRKGDGIRVFGDAGQEQNVIKSNTIIDNAGFGLILSVNASSNRLEKNKASRNGFHSPGSTDLADDNENCDGNVWIDNTGTRNRSCIQ
jgi:parallel beta-helix repeat protein